MDQHTSTPWEVSTGTIYKAEPTDAGGYPITALAHADRDEPNTTPVERDENMAFIVRACNAHDELVAVLTLAEKYLIHPDVQKVCENMALSGSVVLKRVNDALAKAKP